MSLHLRFSHRMEPLLDGFEELLRTLWTSFESPPSVVVPSPSVARWLKLRLCERRGPVLGLETSTLEATLWSTLEPERGDRLLRVPALQQAILDVLDDDLLGSAEFAPVRRFLAPSGNVEPRRAIQFAHETARLFLEYEYNRPSVWNGGWSVPGIDQTWPARPYFDADGNDPTETWQRILHGRAFAPDGPFGRVATERHLGLPRLHRLFRERGGAIHASPLVLFGIDKVSHFHRNLLLEMARETDVHLFLLNPCSTFWEDVDTSRRRRPGRQGAVARLRFRRDDTANEWQDESLSERCYPSASSDPLLLERWGRTARENIALWCQAADYDFEDLGEPAERRTLLGILQESLRQRHPGPRRQPLELPSGSVLEGDVPQDGSLLLLESPDRGREMEAIRNQILSWLSEDPTRTVSDATVLLPDPARHRVEIERVFGGFAPSDPGHIPWTVLGVPSSESLWAQGVGAFLDLVRGPFDRPAVFAVLRNGLCRRRLGLEPATIALWERWSEGAGMIRGWTLEDRSGEDEPTAHHTFFAGLRRLLLAPLAAAEGAVLAPGSDPLPPWRDFDSTDPSLLEPFCAALERLHADRARLRLASAAPPRMAADLLATLDAWFDVSEHPSEAGIRRSLHESLEALRLRGDRPMGIEELSELVLGLLEGELPGSSRAWTGALTFAPLRAGNILPHGFVAIPGLDADAFPRERSTSALDLLSRRRIVGDPDAPSDDRHAFLLALLSCRDRLVLSWRACDIQRDERRDPSSVVLELEDALRTGFVAEPRRLRVRLLEREEAREGELPDQVWDPTVPDAAPPQDAPAAPVPAPDAPSAPARVSTARIRQFLEDPWQSRIERDLASLDDDAPDTLGATDEPLDSTPLARSRLHRSVFPVLLRAAWDGADPASMAAIAASAHRRALWDADVPEGPQARFEGRNLERWAADLATQVGDLRALWPAHALEIGCDPGLRLPGRDPEVAVALPSGGAARVAARIPAALVGPAETDPVILVCPAAPSRSDKRNFDAHRRFEPLLWSLLVRLSTGREAVPVLLPLGAGAPETLASPPPGSEGWLGDVLSDLLAGRCEHLPARLVVDDGKRTLEDIREAIDESSWRSDLAAMLDPRLPGETEGDPAALGNLIRRRLGPFLGEDATDSDEEGA